MSSLASKAMPIVLWLRGSKKRYSTAQNTRDEVAGLLATRASTRRPGSIARLISRSSASRRKRRDHCTSQIGAHSFTPELDCGHAQASSKGTRLGGSFPGRVSPQRFVRRRGSALHGATGSGRLHIPGPDHPDRVRGASSLTRSSSAPVTMARSPRFCRSRSTAALTVSGPAGAADPLRFWQQPLAPPASRASAGRR